MGKIPVCYESDQAHVCCVLQHAQFSCHNKLYLQLLLALKDERPFHSSTARTCSIQYKYDQYFIFSHLVVTLCTASLTFKNLGSYIQDKRTVTLQMLHFIYIFSTNISTEYFKHAAHSPFFSSKCRLFHNATFFGSCIIHILHTGCAKI